MNGPTRSHGQLEPDGDHLAAVNQRLTPTTPAVLRRLRDALTEEYQTSPQPGTPEWDRERNGRWAEENT